MKTATKPQLQAVASTWYLAMWQKVQKQLAAYIYQIAMSYLRPDTDSFPIGTYEDKIKSQGLFIINYVVHDPYTNGKC